MRGFLCHQWAVFFVFCMSHIAIANDLFSFSRVAENQVSFIPGDAQRLWDDYTFNTLATDEYQQGCEPAQYRPPLDVQYRGVIILLHGFTSCPKQFSAMAESFTSKGYHVLVPLLPGHGRAGEDELAQQYDLPGARSWQKYDAFAHWLNELATAVGKGEVHIGGLCLGGTIAMRSMQAAPDLYKRSLLLSPFFGVAQPLLAAVTRLVGPVSDVVTIDSGFNLPFSMGDLTDCEQVERRQLGRAGYCRVRLSNLLAVARFAKYVKDNSRRVSTDLQTILVERDPVAHLGTTLRLLEQNGLNLGRRQATCVMNASASHSMFSPTDLPQPKPWLNDLHQELGDFIAAGKPLIQTYASRYLWPSSKAAVGGCALWP
jgi:alpha-beta hydrolase superfamily lysophospholipase